MGPDTSVSPAAYPLQNTLGGTSIAVTSGTTQVAAIPMYVSSNQLSAILPSATPPGTAALTVTYNGQTSAPGDVRGDRQQRWAAHPRGSGIGISYCDEFPIPALHARLCCESWRCGDVVGHGRGTGERRGSRWPVAGKSERCSHAGLGWVASRAGFVRGTFGMLRRFGSDRVYGSGRDRRVPSSDCS